MYSIKAYGEMIGDNVRMDAYVRALRLAVKPGSVVLDIGTGTGIFALLACRLGARRVFAVEPGDAIQVAREIASANGCTESIEFFQALSTEISLPEPADVIISDLRSVLPLHQQHLPAIADARRRLLAPGGVLIPQSDTLWLACVEAPDMYHEIKTPWSENAYDLDMRAARKLVSNSWRKARPKPEQMLTEPQCCGAIDYATIESPDFSGEVTVGATRAATAHGFCVWFDATLAEGVQFSNAPGKPELIYGKAFFPWPEPVELATGDAVTVTLRANLVGDDYVWSWHTRILGQGDPRQIKAKFEQSTFLAEVVSPAHLRRLVASHVPALNDDGRIDRLILQMMGDAIPLSDIARHLATQHPNRFAKWQDAMTRVGELSAKYSR